MLRTNNNGTILYTEFDPQKSGSYADMGITDLTTVTFDLHNHPSGDVYPSLSDLLISIVKMTHVIVGPKNLLLYKLNSYVDWDIFFDYFNHNGSYGSREAEQAAYRDFISRFGKMDVDEQQAKIKGFLSNSPDLVSMTFIEWDDPKVCEALNIKF